MKRLMIGCFLALAMVFSASMLKTLPVKAEDESGIDFEEAIVDDEAAICSDPDEDELYAEANGLYEVITKGSYMQTDARSMLELLNAYRTSGEAWELDESENKVQLGTLNALTYDYGLEEIAMRRAAEAALFFSHTRPNGQRWVTVAAASTGSRSNGENLAANMPSYGVSRTFEQWMETDKPYSGQGHRRNMLNSGFTTIGIACYVLNGNCYWVQEFGYGNGTVIETVAVDGPVDVMVELNGEYISSMSNLTVSGEGITSDGYILKEQVTLSEPSMTGSLYLNASVGYTWPRATMVTVPVEWTAEDTEIMLTSAQAESDSTLPQGTMKTLKAGETNLIGLFWYENTASIPVTVEHTPVTDKGTSPTCTTSGWTDGSHCSVCQEILTAQTKLEALGHSYSNWKVVSEAKCTEDGSKQKTCSRCSDVQTEVIPALGHAETTDAAVDATCTTTGLTKGSHCSRCSEVFTAQKVIKALGHVEVIDAYKAPTCTASGLTEGKHCSRCETVLTAQNAIPALGHDFGEWIITKEPTPFEYGSRENVCNRCGDTETEEIPMLSRTLIVTADAEQYVDPWINDAKTGVVSEGSKVEFTAIKEEWYQLTDGSWIEAKYVYYVETPAPKTEDKIGQGTATRKVMIYAEPYTEAETCGNIAAGSVKNLYAQSGNWYQIYSGGRYVWVRADGFNFTSSTITGKLTTGIITADTPMYYGPGLDFETCGTIAEGRTVNVYEIRTYGKETWYKIYSGGKYVWVDGNYLYDKATPEPKVEDKIGQGTTTAKTTIYASPDVNSEVMGTVAINKIRNLYAQSGNWYQIYSGGAYVWVRCDSFDYTKANTNTSYATAVFTERTVTYYGHGYDYETAATITAGTRVNVYAQWENWYLVYKTGKYLWIDGKYLKDFALK